MFNELNECNVCETCAKLCAIVVKELEKAKANEEAYRKTIEKNNNASEPNKAK